MIYIKYRTVQSNGHRLSIDVKLVTLWFNKQKQAVGLINNICGVRLASMKTTAHNTYTTVEVVRIYIKYPTEQ